MVISRTITKKILERIVHETFSTLGSFSSSSLLDSLKLLGFYYATNAGISINIEDLKTPDVKKKFIETANQEIDFVSQRWQEGFVSDNERFQSIIDSWNVATEGLKNRIVDYYQYFDPANNLYIMAFSGARGNMSQVRQLVGMRGLMSDQEGKIIDLPIQRNFREGLSSIDYIISSYGARKGIVDTALKTADSGYLTRRLIYLAQDLVIRQIDCQTKKGIVIILEKQANSNNLIGRYLVWGKKRYFPYQEIQEKNIFLTETNLEILKIETPLQLNIRSSLMCESYGSICQTCYGYDLAQNRKISLGESVGIIAAQSIGEPGTQLTMRTFHTGGIFTGETMKQIVAPFSGKIILPSSLKMSSYRTNHGFLVVKLQQETELTMINWKGEIKLIPLTIGSFLYINQSCFLQKNSLIAEYSTQSLLLGSRRLKPIYNSFSGEIKFENLLLQKITTEKGRRIRINPREGVLWITAGNIFPVPIESKISFSNCLSIKKSFAQLKIVTPYSGIVKFSKTSFQIQNKEKKMIIDFSSFIKTLKNCSLKIFPLVKNYQYVDQYTVLALVSIFPKIEGRIYEIRKKDSEEIKVLFVITESDIWKINSDQVNNFSFFQRKKTLVRKLATINLASQFYSSGYFLRRDGFQMIFQKAIPIFLSPKTVLNYKHGDFVLEKKVLGTLLNYTQQTEDIVQGLPKIEELIEARKPKQASYLSLKPGIVLNGSFHDTKSFFMNPTSNGIIKCFVKKHRPSFDSAVYVNEEKKQTTRSKQTIAIAHNSVGKNDFIARHDGLFLAKSVPSFFAPFAQKNYAKKSKNSYHIFKNMLSPANEVLDEKQFYEKNSSELPEDLDDFYVSEEELKKERREEEKDARAEKFYEILRVKGKKIDSKFNTKLDRKPKLFLEKYSNGTFLPWKKIVFSDLSRSRYPDGSFGQATIYENKKKDLMIPISEKSFLFLEYADPIEKYKIPFTCKFLMDLGNFVDLGEPISEGIVDTHQLLNIIFQYHSERDGIWQGTQRSLQKFQLILVNSIQAIYQSQGVNIASKHIEVIVKQMTAKVVIKKSGDTPFLAGELIPFSILTQVFFALQDARLKQASNYFPFAFPTYEPKLLSATNSSLTKDSFLSSAGFQETRRVLSKAALEGSSDWLRGLKECVMIGRLSPAGSTFLNYKNYLDNIYKIKKEN